MEHVFQIKTVEILARNHVDTCVPLRIEVVEPGEALPLQGSEFAAEIFFDKFHNNPMLKKCVLPTAGQRRLRTMASAIRSPSRAAEMMPPA